MSNLHDTIVPGEELRAIPAHLLREDVSAGSLDAVPAAKGSKHKRSARNFASLKHKIDITQRDVITGLLTHEGFMKGYRETFSYRSDTQGPCHADENGMLVLLSIDNYDLIENVYGRSVAYNCLREIGEILGQFLKGDDIAGRLHRDEFALLMRDISLHCALERLHKLSTRLRDLNIKVGTSRIELKINVGLKPYKQGFTAENVMTDASMYRQRMIDEDKAMDASMSHTNRGNQDMRHAVS